jgi:hypothetical protein
MSACFTDKANFGNMLIAYANSTINVHLIYDHSVWSILVAPISGHQSKDWYDTGLIRDMLLETQTVAQSLAEKIEFFESNLPQVIHCFSAGELKRTLARLDQLGEQRARRLLPDLFLK